MLVVSITVTVKDTRLSWMWLHTVGELVVTLLDLGADEATDTLRLVMNVQCAPNLPKSVSVPILLAFSILMPIDLNVRLVNAWLLTVTTMVVILLLVYMDSVCRTLRTFRGQPRPTACATDADLDVATIVIGPFSTRRNLESRDMFVLMVRLLVLAIVNIVTVPDGLLVRLSVRLLSM